MTKVELTISCTNLLDKDVGSKSDPLCVLLQNTSGQQWYEVQNAASHVSAKNAIYVVRTFKTWECMSALKNSDYINYLII